MNKKALAERIYEFDNFTGKGQAREFLEDFLQIIKDEVIAGNTVNLAGFGKFEPYVRGNGEVTPKFRPFTAFKLAVAAK